MSVTYVCGAFFLLGRSACRLLYIAYVMHIWASLISATSVWDKGFSDQHRRYSAECIVSLIKGLWIGYGKRGGCPAWRVCGNGSGLVWLRLYVLGECVVGLSLLLILNTAVSAWKV